MGKWLVVVGWVLLSQTTDEPCLPSGCRPLSPRVGPQVQRVQVTDSRAACEALRTMMAQTMTQTAAQVEQAVKAQSPGNSLWTQTTLVCQEER